MNQDEVRQQLCALLPDADIRTDQCDIVRCYWRKIFGGIRPLPDGRFHVTAGDTQSQGDNITFKSSYSEMIDSEALAIDQLVSVCKSIDRQRSDT